MLSVCVFSAGLTHIVEVQAGDTLSVNAFEFWHARGHSGLVWLTEDLICALALHDYVERMFSVCGLLCSGRRCYVQVSRDESLSYTQSESAERNFLSTVTVFQRLSVNVTDLCRNSLAEQN